MMARTKKIFLIGFSASGKTTLAPVLAARLHYSLLDTDAEIEQRWGIPCGMIIRRKGLEYFRRCERTVVEALCADHTRCCVAALGGGAVTIAGVIPLLRRTGRLFWLRVNLEEILKRTRDGCDRPLLEGKTRDEIAGFIRHREPFYRRAAHRHINSESGNPEGTAHQILHLLGERGRMV